jgi:long-chain acyl-CoA synthetase
LDYALNVNAFGMQNLVALARDLAADDTMGVPFLHTSTAYVAGGRTGEVKEVDPRAYPFPRAGDLDRSHWDPEREIAECVDLVESVRHRSNDAFRQSAFLDQAKTSLSAKGEPTRGSALEDELVKVKRRFEEQQLVDWGTERAQYWGWHNIYTYTKSIGEQILARSGVPFVIARPAVIESALSYPKVGWNEGINTSAPLIYLAVKGPILFPKETDTCLDIIPVDQVAAGMMLTLAELIEGTSKPVYHYGSSDTNGLNINRLIELVGLFKRRHYVRDAGGNPLINWVQSRLEPESASAENYQKWGPDYRSKEVGQLAGFVRPWSPWSVLPRAPWRSCPRGFRFKVASRINLFHLWPRTTIGFAVRMCARFIPAWMQTINVCSIGLLSGSIGATICSKFMGLGFRRM